MWTGVAIAGSLAGRRQPVLHGVGRARDRSARRPPHQSRTIKALGAALPVSADDAVSMARVRFRTAAAGGRCRGRLRLEVGPADRAMSQRRAFREGMPGLVNTLPRGHSTGWGVVNSWTAISWLVGPSRGSLKVWASR